MDLKSIERIERPVWKEVAISAAGGLVSAGILALPAGALSTRPAAVVALAVIVFGLMLTVMTLYRSLRQASTRCDLAEVETKVLRERFEKTWGNYRRETESDLVARYIRGQRDGDSAKEIAIALEAIGRKLWDQLADQKEERTVGRLWDEILAVRTDDGRDPAELAKAVRAFADERGLGAFTPDID